MSDDYWKDCIAEGFEEAKIIATDEQINIVAGWAESSHDHFSMAHGYDCIPNPLQQENRSLQRELEKEKSKMICPDCHGRGRIIENAPWGINRSSESQCSKFYRRSPAKTFI